MGKNMLKKCPVHGCNVFFFTDADLNAHLRTHWKQTSNGEILPVEADRFLAGKLMNAGSFVQNGYKYCLIDNKLIYRTRKLWR